jgi:hypothetical protein
MMTLSHSLNPNLSLNRNQNLSLNRSLNRNPNLSLNRSLNRNPNLSLNRNPNLSLNRSQNLSLNRSQNLSLNRNPNLSRNRNLSQVLALQRQERPRPVQRVRVELLALAVPLVPLVHQAPLEHKSRPDAKFKGEEAPLFCFSISGSEQWVYLSTPDETKNVS